MSWNHFSLFSYFPQKCLIYSLKILLNFNQVLINYLNLMTIKMLISFFYEVTTIIIFVIVVILHYQLKLSN